MTTLERLLRGDKATYFGDRVVKFIDLGEKDGDGDEYVLIYLNGGGFFASEYFSKDSIIQESFDFPEPEKPRTIEDGLMEGDIIITERGHKRLILGICGSAIMVSGNNNFKEASAAFTAEELINRGYKIHQLEQPKPVRKMTVAEVSELVGQTVEIIE